MTPHNFLSYMCRDVVRSENLWGRVITWGPKIWGGRAVRAGPKSGGAYAPPPSNMPDYLSAKVFLSKRQTFMFFHNLMWNYIRIWEIVFSAFFFLATKTMLELHHILLQIAILHLTNTFKCFGCNLVHIFTFYCTEIFCLKWVCKDICYKQNFSGKTNAIKKFNFFIWYIMSLSARVRWSILHKPDGACNTAASDPNENREVVYNDHFEVTIPV